MTSAPRMPLQPVHAPLRAGLRSGDRRGQRLLHYRKSFRLVPYLLHRFHNGRCFAGMRLRELSRLRRACSVAAAPALPIVLTARMLRKTLGKRRHLAELALSFPISLLAVLSWALGELCGYLAGPGVSCDHVR